MLLTAAVSGVSSPRSSVWLKFTWMSRRNIGSRQESPLPNRTRVGGKTPLDANSARIIVGEESFQIHVAILANARTLDQPSGA